MEDSWSFQSMVTRVCRTSLEVFLLGSTLNAQWAIPWNFNVLKGTGQAGFHHWCPGSLPESSQNWGDPSPHKSMSPWAIRDPAMLPMPAASRPQRKAYLATIPFMPLSPWVTDLILNPTDLSHLTFFISPAHSSEEQIYKYTYLTLYSYAPSVNIKFTCRNPSLPFSDVWVMPLGGSWVHECEYPVVWLAPHWLALWGRLPDALLDVFSLCMHSMLSWSSLDATEPKRSNQLAEQSWTHQLPESQDVNMCC